MIIHNQQINMTTVSNERLFSFFVVCLFACLESTKCLLRAITFHWTSAVLTSHSMSTPSSSQSLQTPHSGSGRPGAGCHFEPAAGSPDGQVYTNGISF